jgi:hypothetical protein
MVIDDNKKNLEAVTLLEGARRAYSCALKLESHLFQI